MRELKALTKNFNTSRPVFRLTMERGDSTISANVDTPVYRYRPKPEEGNYLSEMVCEEYRETFYLSEGVFRIDTNDIAQKAMQGIRSSMTSFLEKNLEMRSPTQSKIYRWYYRNLPNDSEFNDVLVMVYKYMRTFTDENMKAASIEHINNTLALLEAIMEKYEQN